MAAKSQLRPTMKFATQIYRDYSAGRRDFRGSHFNYVRFGESPSRRGEVPSLASADFSESQLVDCVFVGAELDGCIFLNAQMNGSNFARCSLAGAVLDGANLQFANCNLADLRRASLRNVNASKAEFYGADLTGADMRHARLAGSVFSRARLTSSRWARANLDGAMIVDTAIDALCVPSLRAQGATVDWRSLARSVDVPRDAVKRLLVKTGMPAAIADYLVDAVLAEPTRHNGPLMHSTFISYGGPDERFARRLRDQLRVRGIETFLFESDAPLGERLHAVMRDGVNRFDRTILVCSRNSLDRGGVINEIEECLTREAREGGETRLIPITLDKYVFHGWSPSRPGLAAAMRDRVVGDFSNAQNAGRRFRRGVDRLVTVLRPNSNRQASPLDGALDGLDKTIRTSNGEPA